MKEDEKSYNNPALAPNEPIFLYHYMYSHIFIG